MENNLLDKKINQYNYSLDNYASSQELMVTITLHEYRELVKEFSTKDAEISKIRCEKYDLEKEVKTQKEAYEELQKKYMKLATASAETMVEK